MKKLLIIISLMLLLLSHSVIATTYDADTISNIDESTINNYIKPKIDTRFFWEDNNLKVRVTYKTIENLNNSYELFEEVEKTYYPSMELSAFYTCHFKAGQSIHDCVQLLVFGSERINYESMSYEPMYYQVLKRTRLEKQKIMDYKEKILYSRLMQNINQELE